MQGKNFQLAESIINPSYIRLAQNSLNKRQKIMKQLLSQRQLLEYPLDDLTIRYFLDSFALMDSNNFHQKVGVGQRQSRIFSNLVNERHYYMGHGIGRSGDVIANQPKAAGSSLLLQLTRYLTVSALKQLNYEFVNDVLILPLATGMTIALSLLMLAGQNPQKRYVIWSRIDQKTCLKSIQTANLIPIVIQLKQVGDSLSCDIQAIQAKIKQIGKEKILAIISTTSCFAPRVPDDVQQISLIAKENGLFHIVNNAYGLWCTKIANKIKQGTRKGQCTIVIQSTDKNFMVPVGGSIVFAKNQKILEKISGKYPGRASGSPIVDLFITLLAMGKSTLNFMKKERKQLFGLFLKTARQYAQKNQFKILQTPSNTISIAMNIKSLNISPEQLTQLGSILYSKRVMGHRIIVQKQQVTKICKKQFKNYGSHSQNYKKLPYITFACAIGTKKQEISLFFKRLEESIKELKKKLKKNTQKLSKETSQVQKNIEISQPIILQKKQQQKIKQSQSQQKKQAE